MTIRTRKRRWFVLLSLIMGLAAAGSLIGAEENEKKIVYEFKIDHEVKHNSVKDQYMTGTCWCFATLSLLESELLRTGKDPVDLSVMYVVRHVYPAKAENYIRLHGRTNFWEGGQSHDVINAIRQFGIVPHEIYPGTMPGERLPNHGELSSVLKAMLDAVL